MKGKFTKIMAAFVLLAALFIPMGMWGQSYTQVTELDMTTKEYGISAYSSNLDYISNNKTWSIVYGANNNKGWAYFKMGGKKETLSSCNPCYIYNKTAITEQVDKVTVHLPAGSLSKNGMSVNSWGLYVYSDSQMTTQVDYVAGGTITNSEASFDFTPSTGVIWAANYFYKVSWDLANTTTTNGIICVDKITLYKESGGTTVSAPTFDPVGGTYTEEQLVELECATEGATIYYTMGANPADPDDESEEYDPNEGIEITETTTIKAIAYVGEDHSSVATATYTLPITIAAVRAQATGNVFTKGIITYISGKNAYIQDATAAICVYGSSNTWNNYAVGDEIAVSGSLTTYGNGDMLEIQNPSATRISQNNALPSVTKTIAEINADAFTDLQCMHVKIENATVTEKDGSNTTISQTIGDVTSTILVYSSNFDVEVDDVIVSFYSNVGYYSDIQLVNPTNVQMQQNPSITTDPTSMSFTYVLGGSAAAQNLTISGDNLEDDITITLSGANFAISEDGNDWSQTTLTIDQATAIGEIQVRLNSGLPIGNNYTGAITLSSTGADDVVVNLSGEVTTPTHTLELYSNAITGGSISFSPESPVPQGATVTLTATPSAGYEFGSWVFYKEGTTSYVVDESIVVNANNEFTMPEYDLWVDATFTELPTYAITAVASPAAGGTIVTDETAWAGKVVEIAVEANDGYALSSLSATYVDGNEETQELTITNNTFVMPAYAVTVTAIFEEYHAYVIDFENELSAYADWEFYKITRTSSTSAHGGSYYATNSTNNSSASITTKNKIANPGTLTFYVKRTSSNTNSATWYVKTSTDGETWTERGNQDATTENWTKYEIDLSPYTNVYVQIAYNGNTALRAIDDISLAYTPAASYALSVTSVEHAIITANVGSTVIAEGTSSNVESGLMVALNAEPDANYQLASWSVYKTGDHATIVEVDANNQFEMPAYPVTVSASFNETCTLTYSVNGNASNDVVVKGTEVTLTDPTANIPSGFDFIGWTSNPANVADADLVTSLTMNANATVYAVFGKSNTLTLTGDDFETSYPEEETQYVFRGIKFGVKQVMKSGGIQFHKGDGYIYNKDAFVGLASIVATRTTSSYICTLKVGNSSNPNEGTEIEALTSGNVDTYTFSDNYSYIVLMNENGSNAVKYSSIVFTFNNTDPARYTRVFQNETATANTTIVGPSIVPSGSTLDMGNFTLTNNIGNEQNLVIEDGAQYIGNSVMATVQKSITACEYNNQNNAGYYLIASPISANLTATNVNGLLTTDYDLYKFNNTADLEWINYKAGAFTIDPEEGYLYASGSNTIIEFAGALNEMGNSGNYTVTVANPGWNLIGNPLPFNVSATTEFQVLNSDGDGFIDGSEINPCDAVLVQTTGTNEEVTFTRAARTAPAVTVDVTTEQGNVIDNVRVRFDEGQGMNKFYLNPNHTKLFITQGNQDFAVVRSANQGEMPVSFKAAKNGTYTINVDVENMEMDYLHLIDNMTGADVDLLATPSYSFEARTTDYTSRFRLVFSGNGTNENGATTGSETFAYFNGSEWQISNMGEATLQVVDVMGRIVKSETISGNASVSLNEVPGVYVMRLVNGENVKTQKIVVR